MKKLLLTVGIISIILCVLLLLFAALELYTYNNLYDGTVEHYKSLRRGMTVSFITGIVFAVAGAVCVILHFRK